MSSGEHKGSKLVLIFIVVVLLYFAFFGFDLTAGVNYAITSSTNFFK